MEAIKNTCLPTPPGTAHRSDKENRAPRVVWSPHNQYHTLSTVSPPKITQELSASKHLPTKSILKNRVNTSLPLPEEKQREITPEPLDPLTDVSYLESSVSKIIAPESSLRDLIESYSILASRLKTTVTGTTDADATWPLFQPLRKNRQVLVKVFNRDLGRALVDPIETGAPTEERSGEEVAVPLTPKDSPRKKQGMSAEQVKYARDLCTTCHAVVKLMAVVFTLPAVYKVFSDDQLRSILTQVLAIPMANELPTPNARKTWALFIWLLQTQRLPPEILLPSADHIAYSLRRGIEGQLGKEGKKGATSDGLKAIHDLSIHQPSTFVPAFAQIVPQILLNLLEPSFALRAQACHALGGLALGYAQWPFSPAHVRIANCISTFLTAPPASSPTTPKSPQDSPIVRTLRTTLSATDPQHVCQGPVWALSVLASFIVLLGPGLCLDAKLTRTVYALLSLAMRHKKSSVRALGCLVWRCVAWAYFQPRCMELDIDADGKERFFLISPTSAHETDADVQVQVKEWENSREGLWRLVKSVVDMGAGVATVAGLLRDEVPRDDSLKRAIALITVMIKRGGQTCGDAMEMAKRLVSFNTTATELDPNKFLPPGLFSANPGLLTTEYKSLVTAVRPIFDQCPQLEDVRPLTRDEVAKDWVFEGLVAIWKEGLGCLEMPDDVETPTEITGIWEGLVKARVTTLQDAGDDDQISQFAIRTVEVLVDVLEDRNLDLSANPEAPDPGKANDSFSQPSTARTQPSRSNAALKLIVVRDLWSFTRGAIDYSLLKEAACAFLATLIQDEWKFVGASDSQNDARKQWSLLCADILQVCGGDEVVSYWGRTMGDGKIWKWTPDVRRLVWSSFVEKWSESGPRSWEAAAVLLGVPFADATSWDLSTDDFDSWDKFLRYVHSQALDQGIDSVCVLDHVADVIMQFDTPTTTIAARVADLLVSHIDMADMHQLPKSLLDFVNGVLRSSYPPAPRDMVVSMWLIRSLIRVIDTCPTDMLRTLLDNIQEGLSIWISDDRKVLSDRDYTFDILPLYETTLVGIQSIFQGIGTLRDFGKVLSSAFCGREDKPTSVSEAFAEFWDATSSAETEPIDGWSTEIRICLESIFRIPTDHLMDQDPPHKPPSQHSIGTPASPVSLSYPVATTPLHTPSKSLLSLPASLPTPNIAVSGTALSTTPVQISGRPTCAGPKRKPLANKENISLQTWPQFAPTAESSPSLLGKRRAIDSGNEEYSTKRVKVVAPANRALESDISNRSLVWDSEEALVSNPPIKSLTDVFILEAGKEVYTSPPLRRQKTLHLDAIEVPTLQEVMRGYERTATSGATARILRRSRSTASLSRLADVSRLVGERSRMRKIRSSYEPLTFSHCVEGGVPGSDDALLFSKSSTEQTRMELSSDDDPYEGQVTPHHLISPAVRRLQTTDSDPPSDDSIMSASPSREAAARRLERVKSLTNVA